MRQLSPARRVAAQILGDVRRRDAYARDVLRMSAHMKKIDERDRALATRLVLGVTACVGQLDNIIDTHVKKRSSLEPTVRDALRLSCFELLHLARPAHIAVSQGVELVASVRPKARKLANAVLRRVAEEDVCVIERARQQLREGLASDLERAQASGLPEWLVSLWDTSIEHDILDEMCLSQLEPAPVWVHAQAKARPEHTSEEALTACGFDPVKEQLVGAYELRQAAGLASSGLVASAELVPSDLAAQLVCAIALPQTNPSGARRMLEIGQGRGTKSLIMLSQAHRCELAIDHVGVDISPAKVSQATARLKQARLSSRSRSLCLDGRFVAGDTLPELIRGKFDTVFLDVPCSGTGTMRRHPETCWSLQAESLDASNPVGLPALQLQMLKAASARVKRSGSLLYATCSVFKEENDEIIDAFLRSSYGEGFEVEQVSEAPQLKALSAVELVASYEDERGMFRSYPVREGCDGHFCARMVRRR